jgi:hypothetical protein
MHSRRYGTVRSLPVPYDTEQSPFLFYEEPASFAVFITVSKRLSK